jgi:putative transcriptional regulator
MSGHVDDQLPELVLGTLGPLEQAAVETHLRSCPSCTRASLEARRTLGLLAAELPPIAPPERVRNRLFAVVRGRGRFAPFHDRIADLFDLPAATAEDLLTTLDVPANWIPGPGGGHELYFVPHGPRLAGADAGFVRLEPGLRYPRHRHLGDEITLVLSGGLREHGGEVFRPGDRAIRTEGSEHSFEVLAEGCIFAVVLRGGLDFTPGGLPLIHRTGG